MKITLKPAKPEINIWEWHDWWVWWPTVCIDFDTGIRELIWLQTVKRRWIIRPYPEAGPGPRLNKGIWEYKLP